MKEQVHAALQQFAAPLSIIATALSIFAVVRTYFLSRPKLRLIQQNRWGKNYLGYVGDQSRIGVSVLVVNPRPQPNAIVNWTAQVDDHGRLVDVPVPSGVLRFSDEKETPYGVLPLPLPPFSATEANLCLFDLPQRMNPPVKLRVTAKDVSGKKHQANFVIEDIGNFALR